MGNFSQLPSDILLDIITRLPAESVLDCKLVCKPRKNLVSHHPSFVQLHSTRLLDDSSDSAGELSFLVSSYFGLYYFKYDDEDDTFPIRTFRMINLTPPYRSHEIKVLGSFNGLVCLHGWDDHYFYCICNPVTKEYVMLPKIEKDYPVHDVKWSRGFGYLPLTNEYKVVQFMVRKEYKFPESVVFTEAFVYTLGSGNGWRNVGRLDYEGCYMYDGCRVYAEFGVFLNGVLHWAHIEGGKVLTLDLAEEKLEYLSPPPLPLDGGNRYRYSMGVLDRVLYYAMSQATRDFSQTESTYCDIWLLKNNNDISDAEQEHLGWSKEFSLPERELLAFTKSGGILCFGYRSLNIYDPVASSLETLADFNVFQQIIHFKTTFVPLKGLAGEEEDIKFMESGYVEKKSTEIEGEVLTFELYKIHDLQELHHPSP
ncbi:F-box protein At3g07870-like isoform X2 [Papaver somniferum]|uniref:F-box protein At3g07870-like isoform X2 n=1 Tax=Papaver somniferum TaxID=3469 RepID=UPI000E704FCB|nr:F-box protein At3g07870-like isoform X2 [Papaver somniferum]